MKVTLAVIVAVVLAFVLGAVSGYAARGASSPVAAVQSSHAASACAVGTHPVVWYSARTWSCTPDAP